MRNCFDWPKRSAEVSTLRLLRFSNLPIRRKLALVGGLTSAAAVLLATLAASGFDLIKYRRSLVRELAVAANLIGVNSSAALLFDDAEAASRVLSSNQDLHYRHAATNNQRQNRSTTTARVRPEELANR